MRQLIVVNKGKKYIVNTPGFSEDVGNACDIGTLWMQSTDGLWYSVQLVGTSGSIPSASLYINQTPLTWVSPGGQDFGYQLLYCYTDGTVHQIYLTGNAGSVAITVNQSSAPNNLDYKPYLYLQSITDSYFYRVSLISGSSYYLFVDQNSKSWPYDTNPPVPPPTPPVTYTLLDTEDLAYDMITEDATYNEITET